MITDSSILVDTCILSNLLSKEADLGMKTDNLLLELVGRNNTFYISEFSKYELLKGANKLQFKKSKELLDQFEVIPNSDQRLVRSIALYNGYSKDPNIKNFLHSISDTDVFIGSLIFTHQKPYLLTADYFDFPRPFFNEVQIWDIDFKKKKGSRSHIYYYLFRANLDIFKTHMDSLLT